MYTYDKSCPLQDKFKEYGRGADCGDTLDSWNDNSQLHPVQKTKEIHGFLWISLNQLLRPDRKLSVCVFCKTWEGTKKLHLPTCYVLTPRSRVLLEKLTGLQLVNKFPAFYGT